MNITQALHLGYDNGNIPANDRLSGLHTDAIFIGRCLAANDQPRPQTVCEPRKGIWRLGEDYRFVVAGTTPDDMRVILFNGSKRPSVLSLPKGHTEASFD